MIPKQKACHFKGLHLFPVLLTSQVKGTMQVTLRQHSPVENQNDLELDFKLFYFNVSCCLDIVLDESN